MTSQIDSQLESVGSAPEAPLAGPLAQAAPAMPSQAMPTTTMSGPATTMSGPATTTSGPMAAVALPAPGTAQAIYLMTQPDATFAIVHAPATMSAGTTGVLFCPLFGWEDLCTHRVRRTWAETLTDAGHPAIRLDLPGTGDSAGSPRTPDQVRQWIASLSAAAAYLRNEMGCARVAAVGIGFGGLLAWVAAAEGAPIDDLLLWATPMSGRRLLREVRGAARLSIDHEIAFEPADAAFAEAGLEPGDLLDEAGQITTGETAEALNAVTLEALPLPDAESRRVLLLQRRDGSVDSDLRELLEKSGVMLTVADGDGYGPMMQYVQEAELPNDAIASSVAWLAGAAGARSASAASPAGSVPTASSIELVVDGVAIRETPFTGRLSSGEVTGIITEPIGVASAETCAVFFGGGSDRRIGPNRAWVDTARRWAARGVSAVRIDLPGMGDADGDERLWDALREYYRPRHVSATVEMLDLLEARGLPGRFVMVGFCSGGHRGLHTALADRRVAGAFAIGLPFFNWSWWIVNVRNHWLTVWRPRPGDGKAKIRLVQVLQRGLEVLKVAGHQWVRLRSLWPDSTDELLKALDRQGTETLLVLKGLSFAQEQLDSRRRHARLRKRNHVTVRRLPGDDHRFRPVPAQRWVERLLDEALTRTLARHANTNPAVTPTSVPAQDGRCGGHLRLSQGGLE